MVAYKYIYLDRSLVELRSKYRYFSVTLGTKLVGCRGYGDSHGYGYGMGMGTVMNPHGFCG